VADVRAQPGLWEQTLWLTLSDNGGPVSDRTKGANNYPLRGGKAGNFQGGVQVVAFASGGLVPPPRRGAVEPGLAHVADLWATLCGLAGVDAGDARAAAAGLPPPDSLDLWPLISGANSSSPRAEVPLVDGATVQGVISGAVAAGRLYKLLVGRVQSDFRGAAVSPTAATPNSTAFDCGAGCLFELVDDPLEQRDVAAQNPAVVAQLTARLAAWQAGVFDPDRGAEDPRCCQAVRKLYRGFLGPFVDV